MGHVRFTPNSDGESGFPQTVMSALPPEADVCGANRHVCFGPIADIVGLYSITSSARASTADGIGRPSVFAVLRLITRSYLAAVCTGACKPVYLGLPSAFVSPAGRTAVGLEPTHGHAIHALHARNGRPFSFYGRGGDAMLSLIR